MGRAKVTITGAATKEPKVRNDGTVDLLIRVEMSEGVPKGLKSLGQSTCLVHIGVKAWKQIANKVNQESFYIIQGEMKANVSPKNIPYIEIVAFNVSLKEESSGQMKKEEPVGKIIKPVEKKSDPKPSKLQNKPKEMFNQWYNPEEIIYLSYNDLFLVEDVHFQTKNINLGLALEKIRDNNFNMNNILAVRPISEQKYALVMGIRGYILAKILNIEKVPVVIKDMSYEEFVKKYAKDPQAILNAQPKLKKSHN